MSRPPLRLAGLYAEALATLTVASLLIWLLSFRRIAALAAYGHQGAPVDAIRARAITRALGGWGRRVPWRAVCFQQGLAAQLMLRRRGLAATLYYGAGHDADGRLVAHVWVRSGGIDVIGCDGIERYGLLAVFPRA